MVSRFSGKSIFPFFNIFLGGNGLAGTIFRAGLVGICAVWMISMVGAQERHFFAEKSGKPEAAALSAVPALPALAVDASPWLASVAAAAEKAAETKKPVLIHFYSTSCGPCVVMERDVFSDPEVLRACGEYYIMVKVNLLEDRTAAGRYGIQGVPTDVILSPEGNLVAKSMGGKTKDKFNTFFRSVATQMKYAPVGEMTANKVMLANTPGTQSAPAVPVSQGARSVTNTDPAAHANFQEMAEPLVDLAELQPTEDIIPYSAPAAAVAGNVSPPHAPAERFSAEPEHEKTETKVAGKMYAVPPRETVIGAVAPQEKLLVAQKPAAQIMLEGYCCVTLVEQGKWLKGDPKFGVSHRGQIYLFGSQEYARRFFENPDHYAVAASGYDVVRLLDAREYIPGSREYGLRYDNVNFVFASEESREIFRNDPEKYTAPVRVEMFRTAHAESGGTAR